MNLFIRIIFTFPGPVVCLLKNLNSTLLVKIFVSFLQPQEDLLCALQGGSAGDFLLHALEQLPEHRLQHHLILAGEMGHSVQQSNLGTLRGVATNKGHCARATRSNRRRRAASFPRKPPPAPRGRGRDWVALCGGVGGNEALGLERPGVGWGRRSDACSSAVPAAPDLQAPLGEPEGNAPAAPDVSSPTWRVAGEGWIQAPSLNLDDKRQSIKAEQMKPDWKQADECHLKSGWNFKILFFSPTPAERLQLTKCCLPEKMALPNVTEKKLAIPYRAVKGLSREMLRTGWKQLSNPRP